MNWKTVYTVGSCAFGVCRMSVSDGRLDKEGILWQKKKHAVMLQAVEEKVVRDVPARESPKA